MYKVGDVLKEHILHQDSVSIAVQDEIIIMYMDYQNISYKEEYLFKSLPLELHLMKYKDVIVFSYCLGKHTISDSCYNPNLSPIINAKPFKDFGYLLLMLLVDADTGAIRAIRHQMLSIEFSNRLVDMIKEEQIVREAFNKEAYLLHTKQLWKEYGTEELFNKSKDIKINISNFITCQEVIFLNDLRRKDKENK